MDGGAVSVEDVEDAVGGDMITVRQARKKD